MLERSKLLFQLKIFSGKFISACFFALRIHTFFCTTFCATFCTTFFSTFRTSFFSLFFKLL